MVTGSIQRNKKILPAADLCQAGQTQSGGAGVAGFAAQDLSARDLFPVQPGQQRAGKGQPFRVLGRGCGRMG